jgi:DNA (cytosine-5)-methyltransferase 1
MGYHRAGFDVTGVDFAPQKHYPFAFHQADALEFCREHGHEFDAIHASPPCQGYSISLNMGGAGAPKLIESTREILILSRRPWVIENVMRAPMPTAVMLCGATFGLGIDGWDMPRHRLFEMSTWVLSPPCQHKPGNTIGVYGGGTNGWHVKHWGRAFTVKEKQQAMGIDWMTGAELSQAIPPAYTEWIGKQLLWVVCP